MGRRRGGNVEARGEGPGQERPGGGVAVMNHRFAFEYKIASVSGNATLAGETVCGETADIGLLCASVGASGGIDNSFKTGFGPASVEVHTSAKASVEVCGCYVLRTGGRCWEGRRIAATPVGQLDRFLPDRWKAVHAPPAAE